jgi:hypothetical protein
MVSFLGEELDRETSYIPDSICTTLLAAGCTKAEQNWSLLADSIQELGRRERRNIISYFELAPGACSLSMDNSVKFP